MGSNDWVQGSLVRSWSFCVWRGQSVFEGLGAGIFGSLTLVFSWRGQAQPSSQVGHLKSSSRSQYPGSCFPRAAPRQLHPVDWSGYQGTVLTPGPNAIGIVPDQAPSSGPVPGDAENAIPDNGVWSINDQGEHVFRMRVPCLPDQLGEGSWRLGNDKRGAWLDLREEAADNGYVLSLRGRRNVSHRVLGVGAADVAVEFSRLFTACGPSREMVGS